MDAKESKDGKADLCFANGKKMHTVMNHESMPCAYTQSALEVISLKGKISISRSTFDSRRFCSGVQPAEAADFT